MIRREHLITAGAFVLTLALGLAGYRAGLDSVPPVYEVYSHPTPVVAPVVSRKDLIDRPIAHAGEVLYIYRESCWTRVLPGKIKRSLMLDGKAVVIFEVIPVGNVALGCQGITGMLRLPADLPPETYTLDASIEFEPNPLMTTVVRWGQVTIKVQP